VNASVLSRLWQKGFWILFVFHSLCYAQHFLQVLDAETGEPISQVFLRCGTTVLRMDASLSREQIGPCDTVFLIHPDYETLGIPFPTFLQIRDTLYLKRKHGVSLPEVLLVGNRVSEPREAGHEFTSVLALEEIRFNQPSTVPDILSHHGMVYVQKSQQAGGSPMFRGFATYRLVNLLDGVRLNNAIYRGGNIHHLVALDPYTIVRSEVVYGPSSVLYGSDAIGGAILFYTLTPGLDSTGTWHGALNLLYTSANQGHVKHVHFSHHRRTWAFLSSFTLAHYGDLQMGSNGPEEPLRTFYVVRINDSDMVVSNPEPLKQIPSGYHQFNLLHKVVWQPQSGTRVTYAFHYSVPSQYPRYGRLFLVGSNSLPSFAQWDYGPQQWSMHHLAIERRKPTRISDQLTFNCAYQFYEEIRVTRRFQSPNRQTQHERLWSLTSNLDLEKRWGSSLHVFYGLEYLYNRVDSKGVVENIQTGQEKKGPPRYPTGFWTSSAAYLNLLWSIAPKLRMEAGVRGNWITWQATFDTSFYPLPVSEESNVYSALTGHLSLRYSQSAFACAGRVSTSFRAPNFDDIGKVFDSQPGKVVVPNPNLKGEYGYGADLILRWARSQKYAFSLVPYWIYLDRALMRLKSRFQGQDSIVYDGFLSEVQMVQNGSWIQVYGVQCQIQWRITRHLVLHSTFNYQKGAQRSETGEQVPPEHIIPLFGQIQLEWQMATWRVATSLVYNGKMEPSDISPYAEWTPQFYPKNKQGETYVPGWYVLNVRFQKQINPAFVIRAGVENLTDQRYVPYRSGIAGPGRQFILGVDYQF